MAPRLCGAAPGVATANALPLSPVSVSKTLLSWRVYKIGAYGLRRSPPLVLCAVCADLEAESFDGPANHG